MRILHVLDHSLPVQSGYALRTAAILREQRKLGWETIQATGIKHGDAKRMVERVDDLEYHRTPDPRTFASRLPVVGQLEGVRLLRRRLRGLIAQEDPDVVHVHSPCLNGLAAFGLGRPVLYEMRSSWEDAAVSIGTTVEGSARYRLSRLLETWVLRRADEIATICEGLRREIVGRGIAAERVTVVPNAVGAESPRQDGADGCVRADYRLEGRYVIGFIGSLFAWEGIGLLIEALPALLKTRSDAHVLIVGDGVDAPAIRRAVARSNLEDRVTFAGTVPHARIGEFYAAIDLLVYPRLPTRLTEMVTPLKPLEAMTYGKALVASDVGGHRELIEDGVTGVLFRAGDAAALASAVMRVARDPELARRLCESGPRLVRERRTWDISVRRYAPAYERLRARRGR